MYIYMIFNNINETDDITNIIKQICYLLIIKQMILIR